MFYTDYLPGEYPFFFRLVLLIALLIVVYRCTSKGVQNGVLIGLISGATSIVLFTGREIMPGLPNNISLDRIVWPVVVAIFLIKRWRGQTERQPLDLIEWALLTFLGLMLASMIVNGSYVDVDGEWNLFFILRGYGLPFAAYFIVRRSAGTAKHFHGFVVSLGYFTLYLAFIGVAEIFKIHALVFPQFILNPDEGIHFGQVRGLFLNASMYGLALAMGLPFLIWLYFNDRAPRRYLWVLAAALAAPCLLYTFQRAAWLSAGVAWGIIALAWPKRQVLLTWCSLFVVMCGFWFASESAIQRLQTRVQDQETIDYRFLYIERGLVLFRTNPLLGVGINRYGVELDRHWGDATLKSNAHNTWITLLAELGLVGILAYALPFVFALLQSMYGYLRFPRHRALLGIVIAVTSAYLVMATSIDMRVSLYSNGLLLTIWAMILPRLSRPPRKRESAQREVLSPGEIRVMEPMMQQLVMPSSFDLVGREYMIYGKSLR